MLIKHIKAINTDDDYIRVNKDEIVYNIAQKLIDIKQDRASEKGSEGSICTPILAAYVIEDGKPLGVIYEETIIEEIILKGKDPKELQAKDIMKEPICCNYNQEIRDVLNIIIEQGCLTIGILDGDQIISVISVFDAIFLAEEISDI